LVKKLEKTGDNIGMAAVSRSVRTQLTALEAGFVEFKIYPVLDEAITGLSKEMIRRLLIEGYIPDEALRAADRMLKDPPLERFIVSHGLLVAALSDLTGLKSCSPVPDYCETREMEF
jgi:hypothetical protein